MSSTEPTPPPVVSGQRWDAAALIALVHVALAGVGGTFVTTGSLPVTVLAGVVVIVLTALVLFTQSPQRRGRRRGGAKRS